jgi:AmmeMemoRadiSam system protein B
MHSIRKPVVAGMFYEEDPEALVDQIINCFKSNFGPTVLPVMRKDKLVRGIIAPHAGYQFSGPCQAFAYKELAESEKPETYVIIGTSHQGFDTAALTMDDFETPLGIVKVDSEFAEQLIEKGVAFDEKYYHIREHSIEVQLPFLQFANEERQEDIKIVPIVAGQLTDYRKLGNSIAEVAKQLNRKITLIASSDFTHYGVSYGYVPFTVNVKENLKKLDFSAIKHIEKLDSEAFLIEVDQKEMTVCGARAIAAVIEACKATGATKAKLLQYYTSGDITKDYQNAVGYASILIE